MNTCYIVGAGELYGSFTPQRGDLVIAADGGYDHLTKLNIRPDLLVGDLDSLKSPERPALPTVRHKVEKDETDMHLSYLEGRKRGYLDFEIFGGAGGREDHTFANYSLLYYIAKNGGRAKLHLKNAVATVICNSKISLSLPEGRTVSVFAFGKEALGVTVSGLYYEAERVTLTPEFPLGVSNHSVGKEATVSVEDGALLIMWQT